MSIKLPTTTITF